MEVVLVDDGSSDATPIKCDAWAIKDNRVRVIHQANCGSSAARENGLRAAKGEYITFVDADDWLAGDMYRDMIDGMEREKADIAVCGVADAFIAPPISNLTINNLR